MPTSPYFIGALPLAAAADKSALRSGLALGAPLVLGSTDDPQDVVAVDPGTGASLRCIIYAGMVFALDATDTISSHDGVSVLVSYDGKRFKRDGANIGLPTAVLAVQNTPPASPVVGDAYLVGTAPTGAWASRANNLALRQSAGWVYVTPRVGWILYVSGTDTFYRYTAAAAWLAGVGNSALSASSVLASNLLVPPRFIVQNSTTNTPPSVSNGIAYIVGGSPTGAWIGQTGKIAIGEGGNWTFYAPGDGWLAFDLSTRLHLVWRSATTAWVDPFANAGKLADFQYQETLGTESLNGPNGGPTWYTYSLGTAPTLSGHRRFDESLTITFAAKATSRRLVIEYMASAADSSTIALFRDADNAAIAWQPGGASPNFTASVVVTDTSSHVYRIRFHPPSVISTFQATRRIMMISEYSS